MMNKLNPSAVALTIIEEQHIAKPEDIRDLDTLLGLAACYKVLVRSANLPNCVARISISNGGAVITYDKNMHYEPRVKFSVAHELGHYFLHRETGQDLYEDTSTDFKQKGRRSDLEAEADEFASELLMPMPLFNASIESSGLDNPDFNLALHLASDFNVSLTAAAMRLVSCQIFCCALVAVEDGKVCWFQSDPEFIYRSNLFDLVHNPLPKNTYISDFYNKGQDNFQPDQIDADCWFEEAETSDRIYEHSFPMISNNRSLTLLWY